MFNWANFNHLPTQAWFVPWRCRQSVKNFKKSTPLFSWLSSRSVIHHCLFQWPHLISPPSHVPQCAGRCLTWSWVRSSTSLRTRRRVDRLPRSCPTSSSTAKLSSSLVRLSFFLLFIFSNISGVCKWFCQSQVEEFSLALFIPFYFWHPTTRCPVILRLIC